MHDRLDLGAGEVHSQAFVHAATERLPGIPVHLVLAAVRREALGIEAFGVGPVLRHVMGEMRSHRRVGAGRYEVPANLGVAHPAARALGPAVHVESELALDLEALRAIADRCDGEAFLRFARAPFVVPRGDTIVVGDLRYDRETSLGFAEMELPREAPAGAACPRYVPGWEPWRASDLLAR